MLRNQHRSNYSNLASCLKTRSANKLFEQYHNDRSKILTKLQTDPDHLFDLIYGSRSVISFDDKCLCQLGAYIKPWDYLKGYGYVTETETIIPGQIRRSYRCSQCANIGHLVDLNVNAINQPFRIEVGSYKNRRMIIEPVPTDSMSLQRTYQTVPNQMLWSSSPFLEPDLEKQIKYLGLDSFMSRLLVSWYANHILSKEVVLTNNHNRGNISGVESIKTAFVCNDSGYYLREEPRIGYLGDLLSISGYIQRDQNNKYLHSNVIQGILKQLVVILKVLSKHQFSMGGPDYTNLKFDQESVNYSYDGRSVVSSVSIVLSDLSKAGITVIPDVLKSTTKSSNSTRIYPRSELAETQMRSNPFKTFVRPLKPRGDGKGWYIFNHGETLSDISMALPYFQQSSFDLYMYLLMMMLVPEIYRGVKKDPKLFRCWTDLWLPDEYERLDQQISEYHTNFSDKNPNYIEKLSRMKLLGIISKYHLRGDSLYFFELSLFKLK